MVLLIEANIHKGLTMTVTHISNATYEVLMRAGIDAGLVGAGRASGMKNAGVGYRSDSPRVAPGEDSGGTNSGEKDAGRNRRQFTGGDVKQMRRCREVKFHLIVNPNHMAQAMPTADMRQTTQKPTRIAPRGVVSLMLVVDNT